MRIGNGFPDKLRDQGQWFSGDAVEHIKPFTNKEATQLKTSEKLLAVFLYSLTVGGY